MSGPYTPAQQRAASEAAYAEAKPWIEKGWTVAGGIWGEAAWKQITPELVVGLSDSRMGLDNPYPEEPVVLWVYRAPFEPGWTLTHGEAPCGFGNLDNEREPEMLLFPTFAEAEAHVATLEQAGAAT